MDGKFLPITLLIIVGCGLLSAHGQRQWTRIEPQVSPEEFNSLKFTDTLNGWAMAVNHLVRTRDGGKTWHILYTFDYPNTFPNFEWQCRAMDFVDTLHGVIGRMNGDVHTTHDGGKSWKTVSLSNINLRGVDMVSPMVAYVAGYSLTELVYKTVDGGNTWKSQQLPSTNLIFDLHFMDPEKGWASGQGGVFKTTNGGALWSPAGLAHQSISQIHFTDADTGYALDPRGNVFKTVNGGIAWLLASSIDTQQEGGGFLNMDFSNGRTGIVGNISSGKVHHTRDGAQTWSTTKLRIVQGVSMPDTGYAWTIGYLDHVYRYGPAFSVPDTSLGTDGDLTGSPRLYPNPFSGVLNFWLPDQAGNGPWSMELYDVFGSKVFSFNARNSDGQGRLDLAHLKTGAYLAILSQEERRFVVPVINVAF